jgi:hypothetical protein
MTVKLVANHKCYKICLRKIFLALNTGLAIEAHLADGQFVHEGENWNCANSLMYLTETRGPMFPREKGRIRDQGRRGSERERLGDASSYGGRVILTAPERENNGTGHWERSVKRRAANLLNALQLIGVR